MLSHKKPKFKYKLKVGKEIDNLANHLKKPSRRIPKATKKNVLIATWNLTNFGQQKRQKGHLQIMADIIKPFDVVAIQEVADILRVHRSTISRYAQSGELKSYMIGNRRLFKETDVWLFFENLAVQQRVPLEER